MAAKRTCPCCGYRTLFTSAAGSREICPVCFWADDPEQASDPDMRDGSNAPSLREARRNFARFGACERAALPHVRRAAADELRDELRDEPRNEPRDGHGWVVAGGAWPAPRPLAAIRRLQPREVGWVAELALRFGLLELRDVVAWADSIIADAEKPPYWAIELALARPENIEELLRQIPGEPSEDLVCRTFLALARHHWCAGRLSINAIRGINETLFYLRFQATDFWSVVGLEIDVFDAGYLSEEDLRVEITKHLLLYARFDAVVPGWMLASLRPGYEQEVKARLYRDALDAASDILTREWNPIGASDEPMPRDEYHAYVPEVLRLIVDGRDDQEIAGYLRRIEVNDMGLKPGETAVERSLRTARWLRQAVAPLLVRPG